MMLGGLVLGLTFAASWWLTRFLALPGRRWSILDHPTSTSLHRTPRPRTGGVAIIASGAMGLALAAALADVTGEAGLLLRGAILELVSGPNQTILVATLCLAAVSLCDDRWRLPPWVRLAVHGLVALAVVGVGLRLTHIGIPMVGQITLGWAGYPISILFVVWMVNLHNFMDGIDGLAAGMGVIGFTALAAVAWHTGALGLALLGILTVAATAGFLVHNFPPARIFMGDVGSTTLGFLVAAYTLRASHDGIFESWIPFIAFSPFIVDTTVTVVRRALRRERIWEPHLQHAYQRLVLAGWSHRRTVLWEYLLMAGCGVAAYMYFENTETRKAAIISILAAVYVALAIAVRLVAAGSPAKVAP